MKRFAAVVLTLLASTALAQTAHTSTSASSNTSVSAGAGTTSAGADTSVSASQQGNVAAGRNQSGMDANSSAQANSDAQARSGANSNAAAQGNSQSRDKTSAKSAEKANSGSQAQLASATTVQAVLSQAVDARRAKPGQQVMARTTSAVKSGSQVVIPKGATLVGHITQASARANGDANSQLAIVFDRAVLKNGQEMALQTAIQAIAAPPMAQVSAADELASTTSMSAPAPRSQGAGQGAGVLSTASSTTGAALGTVTHAAADVTAGATGSLQSGTQAASAFNSNSSGVFGLSGLSLTSAGDTANGAVITSSGKNVRLDSGTRLLLHMEAAAH